MNCPLSPIHLLVKSIKKHLCVVIPVHDIMAVAILNGPKMDIEVGYRRK